MPDAEASFLRVAHELEKLYVGAPSGELPPDMDPSVLSYLVGLPNGDAGLLTAKADIEAAYGSEFTSSIFDGLGKFGSKLRSLLKRLEHASNPGICNLTLDVEKEMIQAELARLQEVAHDFTNKIRATVEAPTRARQTR